MAKTEIIHVAVEPDTRKRLTKLAKREDMSVSAVIRVAIRNHLEVMIPKEQVA